MTAVHNQAACGSCWAFSAVGAVEAVYNIATNYPDLDLDLSEEFLNSDCPAPNPGSCCGGGHSSALNIIRDDGIPDEACMPYDEPYYLTGDCSCFANPPCDVDCSGLPASCSNLNCSDRCVDWASRLVTIDSHHSVPANQADIKQRLVDEGPLAVCLAMRGTWDAQGVYRCTACWDRNGNGTCETAGTCGPLGTCTAGLVGQDCTADAHCDEDKNDDGVCDQDDCGVNHCVVIVGYDDAGGHWNVKNSYGNTWRGDGYWEVGYGECHIEDHVRYVEPDDLNFPPIADANGPYNAECQGATTEVPLDGTGSDDPNADDTLTFSWTTTCLAGSFDDASSATPALTVDTSPGCFVGCDVSLTVTDDDGETDTATASVTIRDTSAPALTIPPDVTVECEESTDPSDTGYATATDTCDAAPVISYTDVETPGACPQEKTIARTWTATDACGNASSGVQTITVVDITPPAITAPPDVTVECDESTDPSDTGYATATDPCDAAPVISYTDVETPGACPQEKTITRTWTATDACGNVSSEAVQTITVVDTTPPALTIPPDVTVECDESTDPSDTGYATATDTCDAAPVISYTDVETPGACPQEKTIARTWTVTDACGNVSSEAQTITVVDTTSPVIRCNAPGTITPPDGPISFTATATDNCDDTPTVEIIGFDCFRFTGNGKRIDKKNSCRVIVVGDSITIRNTGGIGTHITWGVRAVDSCGTVRERECGVEIVRRGGP